MVRPLVIGVAESGVASLPGELRDRLDAAEMEWLELEEKAEG